MAAKYTRRRVLGGLSFAAAAPFLAMPRALAADPPPEVTTVRLHKIPVICFAPQYVCEELLRAEGFTDIRYVEADPPIAGIAEAFARGNIDFATNVTAQNVAWIDAGVPVTLVAGVHAGCYELFAQHGIRGITDLKGRRIGTIAATDLIEMMAAYVGLDPKKDLIIVNDPAAKPLQQFIDGKLDAYMALPPEPQQLHGRGIGNVIVRTAVDRPWSQYFCCTLVTRRDFAARYPVATKRVIRAILKAADLCASEPERAARQLVDGGFAERYEDALQTLNENPYARWRDYDAEDTVRFYALRLREVGAIKKTPQKIMSDGTDWRFINDLKRELKA